VIELTRLNGQRFVLNAELIRTIEETPDTTITLTTGDRMLVKEPMRGVVERCVCYARTVRRFVPETCEAQPRPAETGAIK